MREVTDCHMLQGARRAAAEDFKFFYWTLARQFAAPE
jgi:hypothetical protein